MNDDDTATIIAIEREKALLLHEIRDELATIAHRLGVIHEAIPDDWILRR